MAKISFSYNSIKRAKVLVVGDFMLDVYIMGTVKRISPEAPVPVLCVKQESRRAGGAGNALLNLVSLGMEVVPVGRVGEDGGGRDLLHLLREEKVNLDGIIRDPSYRTPVKSRMIADYQQLLRVDHEEVTAFSPSLEKELIAHLPTLLQEVTVIAISDYSKGFLTPSLLAALIESGQKRSIPIIVDPKGADFTKYKGVTVLKPNLSEAVIAAGLGSEASLDSIGEALLKKLAIPSLMITRSQEGISVFSKQKKRQDFPAQVREVRDVTGAGDTVLAVVTAAIANQLDLSDAALLANVAAGMAVERIGCARISLAELHDRLIEVGLA